MIFASVGTQEPFDRLVEALDRWAERNDTIRILAQIGQGLRPRAIEWVEHLPPAAFREALAGAELIVAHAGMGTLLHALELGKPIVVMPRRAALGEHRSNHQLATAELFCERRGVRVVHDAQDLGRVLDDLQNVIPAQRIGGRASERLLRGVRAFIEAPRPSPR